MQETASVEPIGEIQKVIKKYSTVFSSNPRFTPLLEIDTKLLEERSIKARP